MNSGTDQAMKRYRDASYGLGARKLMWVSLWVILTFWVLLVSISLVIGEYVPSNSGGTRGGWAAFSTLLEFLSHNTETKDLSSTSLGIAALVVALYLTACFGGGSPDLSKEGSRNHDSSGVTDRGSIQGTSDVQFIRDLCAVLVHVEIGIMSVCAAGGIARLVELGWSQAISRTVARSPMLALAYSIMFAGWWLSATITSRVESSPRMMAWKTAQRNELKPRVDHFLKEHLKIHGEGSTDGQTNSDPQRTYNTRCVFRAACCEAFENLQTGFSKNEFKDMGGNSEKTEESRRREMVCGAICVLKWEIICAPALVGFVVFLTLPPRFIGLYAGGAGRIFLWVLWILLVMFVSFEICLIVAWRLWFSPGYSRVFVAPSVSTGRVFRTYASIVGAVIGAIASVLILKFSGALPVSWLAPVSVVLVGFYFLGLGRLQRYRCHGEKTRKLPGDQKDDKNGNASIGIESDPPDEDDIGGTNQSNGSDDHRCEMSPTNGYEKYLMWCCIRQNGKCKESLDRLVEI